MRHRMLSTTPGHDSAAIQRGSDTFEGWCGRRAPPLVIYMLFNADSAEVLVVENGHGRSASRIG